MVLGKEKYLSEKVDKASGKDALKKIGQNAGKFSSIATAIPALGISTAIGAIIGSSIGIIEVFTQNNKAKTAKTIIRDFISNLYEKDMIKQNKYTIYKTTITCTSVNSVAYKSDVETFLELIKESFKGTKLAKAVNSLYLSDIPYSPNNKINVIRFRVNNDIKPIVTNETTDKVLDIVKNKYVLIGIGLLIFKFLIFKG